MNNILITTLKEDADANLRSNSEYCISVNTLGETAKLLLMWTDATTKHIRTQGDLQIINEDIRETGKHMRPEIKGKGILFIPCKNTLSVLSLSSDSETTLYTDNTIDIGDFCESPELTQLNLGNATCEGSINGLCAKLINLTMDRFTSKVTGDISRLTELQKLTIGGTEELVGDISRLTKLTELSINSKAKISGNISGLKLSIFRGDESAGNKFIWTNSTLTSARVSYRGLWINNVDLFLQNIASRPKSSSKSRIEVYGDNFTPASSDAIAKLIADGEVLTINGIVYNA